MCAPNEAEVHEDVSLPSPVPPMRPMSREMWLEKARNRALLTQGARKHTPGKA